MSDVIEDTAEAAAVRAEVRAWLAEHWVPGKDTVAFLDEACDDGWACPTWPEDLFGRGLADPLGKVVTHEFRAAGAPIAGSQGGNVIAANTIRMFGESAELRTGTLRGFLTGAFNMCALYSEPGAGSDLASLQTRADRDGDDWVVNGQKVWTSGAREATHGLLLARTDWDVPKHKGITLFVFPMAQDGVEIRPIKMITGEAHFNEVFLTDARVPDANRLGPLNDGWRVMQSALAIERMLMGGGIDAGSEQHAAMAAARGGVDLVALAKATGRNTDSAIRQEIARLHALRRVQSWNAKRAAGSADQRLASILKLAQSEIGHASGHMQARLLGPEAMLWTSSQRAEAANRAAIGAFVNSIGGGSDQIQRNLIGERVLGLARDPSVDRELPFKDVPKAAVRSLT